MIDLTPIEERICQTLRNTVIAIHASGVKGNGPWTYAIKEQLGNLGYTQGYKVCTAGFGEEFDPAWLYDMVWYTEDEKGFLLDVPLAVESEWQETMARLNTILKNCLLSERLTG